MPEPQTIGDTAAPKRRKTQSAVAGSGSPLKRYCDVVVGRRSVLGFLYFEWCAFLALWPGAMGLFLRQLFWPRLFGSCGKKVTFGRNIVLRHPRRIHLGNRVVISEDCILDARTESSDRVIEIGDNAILSNRVMLSCKGGTISVGARSGLGPSVIAQCSEQNPIRIGSDVFIGAMTYIVGGGMYNADRLDIPMAEQGMKMTGGASVGDDVWIGAHVTILGGAHVGNGCILGAGTVVTKSVEPLSVCVGVPARVVRKRGQPAVEGHGTNA